MSMDIPDKTTNKFKVISKFIKDNYDSELELSHQQIALLCVNWVADTLSSEDSREKNILTSYLYDASEIGLDDADTEVVYGELIPLIDWAEQQGLSAKDNGNVRRYAREGRIRGARKIGRNWFVPKHTALKAGKDKQ